MPGPVKLKEKKEDILKHIIFVGPSVTIPLIALPFQQLKSKIFTP